ncbi:MAG: helix-turn-helix domain-containing protein [Actinomycetes bacterium]
MSQLLSLGAGMSELLSLDQAAAALGVHRNTVRRLVARGELPAVRIGPRLVRVSSSDLKALCRPLAAASAR